MKSECCQSETIEKSRPDTPHYAQEICGKCSKHIRWVKAPENEGRRTQASKYDIERIHNHYNFVSEEPFCCWCLRTKEKLGLNETLTRDHIEEIDKGGKDELGNLQIICSACHKLKNWARLYMNWHFNEVNK